MINMIKRISFPFLFLMSIVVVSDFARFKFGIDLSFVFVVAVIFNYFVIYKGFIKELKYYLWWVYLIIIPTIISINVGGDVGNMINATCILLLPFALEPILPNEDKSFHIQIYLVWGLSVLLMFFYINFGFLKHWNTNVIGYLLFFGVSASALVLVKHKWNILLWLIYGYSVANVLQTDSRNVAIALIMLGVFILFEKLFSKKVLYRVSYIAAILYSPLSSAVMGFIENNEKLYQYLLQITIDSFQKYQLFSGRVQIFYGAQELIKQSLLGNIFGYGRTLVSFYAAHNGYYLLRYTYGMIGTIIIAIMLVIFFEIAFKLIAKGDKTSYACVCIIIATLFQQGSEGWFLGTYLLTLMPFVYMAIVIKKYRESIYLENEL